MILDVGTPSVVESITRSVLLGTGTFTAAMLMYLSYVRFRSLLKYKHPYDLAYLMMDIGVAITKVIIDFLVFGQGRLPLSWIVVAYTFGETIMFFGVMGVCLYHRRVQQ